MKKILLLAAVLGFVGMGLLTGCQKSETTPPPAEPSTNAPAAPATNAPATPAPAQ